MDSIKTIMYKEHQLINDILKAIKKNNTNIDNGEQFNIDFYMGIADFLKHYVEKIHHTKEEDILFPLIQELNNIKNNEVVQTMIHQHILSRALTELLEEAIENEDIFKVKKVTNEYSDMIIDHIEREDNILFPILEKELPDESKKTILDKFSELDNEYHTLIVKYKNLAEKLKVL